MPLYEYECQKCGRRTEKIETLAGPHLKKCPHCGGKVEQLMSAPAIQFKGSGWYVTDYAGKNSSAESGAGKPGEGKESGAKETAAAKESSPGDSGSKEKKASKKK